MWSTTSGLPAILQKGEFLKKSEIELLIEDGVPKLAIAEAVGMEPKEFNELLKAWFGKVLKHDLSHITPEKYNEVRDKFRNEIEIAEYFGVTREQLASKKQRWRNAGIYIGERKKRRNIDK